MLCDWFWGRTHKWNLSLKFKVKNGTKMEFERMSLREIEVVSRLVILCPWFVNGGSIYRKRFGSLEWSESQDHMLWIFLLVFEASLTNMVSMHSTRLVGWLTCSRQVASGFEIMYMHKEQVQISRRVDFVIKATFPKWQCYLCTKNGLITWVMAQKYV